MTAKLYQKYRVPMSDSWCPDSYIFSTCVYYWSRLTRAMITLARDICISDSCVFLV